MKAPLRRRLHTLFKSEVPRQLPGFAPLVDAPVPKSDLVFSAKPCAGLRLFVILEVKRDADAFDVSLAWSEGDEQMPLFAAMTPGDQAVDGKLRFSLSRLWDSRPSRDPWYWRATPSPSLADLSAWSAPEPSILELEGRMDELATDALNRLGRDAGPYFSRLIEQRGRSSS